MRYFEIVSAKGFEQVGLRLHSIDIYGHQHFRKLLIVQSA